MLVSIDIVAIVAGDNADEYFRLSEIAMFPILLLMFLPAWLVNTGKLAFVRAFRVVAVIVSVAYAVTFIVDAVAAVSNTDEAGAGLIAGILLLLMSPIMFFMWRDFRRCRWLDPNSLPHEWEIAAIRDPNSINYRPPKQIPKPDQKPAKAKRRH
jgi:hypothetical protein